MRVLMTVQYYKILFGSGANVTELLKSFDGAQVVEEKGGYGEPKKYIPTTDIDLQVSLINDDSLTLPENESETFEQYHKVASERDKLKTEVRELKENLKKIEASMPKNTAT